MTEMNHTKDNWESASHLIYSKDTQETIALCGLRNANPNARRIVSCVNAMKGFSDPESCTIYDELYHDKLEKEITKLKQQRYELLKYAKRACTPEFVKNDLQFQSYKKISELMQCVKVIEEAITKGE